MSQWLQTCFTTKRSKFYTFQGGLMLHLIQIVYVLPNGWTCGWSGIQNKLLPLRQIDCCGSLQLDLSKKLDGMRFEFVEDTFPFIL